jgi:hypothetical protein
MLSVAVYRGAVGASVAGVRPVTNESSFHIFSIGYESLVLEAWLDTSVGT